MNQDIEELALAYGREICDCPTNGIFQGQIKPRTRIFCWRCRVNFDKKYAKSIQLPPERILKSAGDALSEDPDLGR